MSWVESESVSQKMKMKSLEAFKSQKPQNIWILKTSWYPEIIEGLEKSSRGFLEELGVKSENITTVEIPGACELPFMAQNIIRQSVQPIDFLVVLGCVVNGETPHFNFVCSLAFEGLLRVQLDTSTPMGIGVLTVQNLAQAQQRIQKGAEAAQAAYQVWALSKNNFKQFSIQRPQDLEKGI